MKLNKKAFTLVELLAVIVVLAIVAAIAMRAITGIINDSRVDGLASSVNAVAEAAEMSCVQTGDTKSTETYLKANDVDIDDSTDGKIKINAKSGSNFDTSNVTWDKVKQSAKLQKSLNLTGSGAATTQATLDYTCD